MFTLTLKKTIATAAITCGSLSAALPATAAPISWATWSNVVRNATHGSATATFATAGVTASYSGELERFGTGYASYGPASTFSGGAVDNAPPTANGIITIAGGAGAPTDTITFSKPVVNPVMAIWSLGQAKGSAEFKFNQPFTIQSGGPNAENGGSTITASGNNLFGNEGNGVIQFTGTFTSISWTNPNYENWFGFTVGTPVAAVPEPETYALMLGGLGVIAMIARRRRAV